MTEKPKEEEEEYEEYDNEEEEEQAACKEITGVSELSDGRELPSSMYFTNISVIIKSLVQDPEYPDGKVSINLIGVLELKIIPHSSLLNEPPGTDILAPNMPASMIITYLDDIFDPQSYKTILYTSIRSELESFKKMIDPVIKGMKDNMKFKGPDLTPKLGEKAKPKKVRRAHSKTFRLVGKSNILTPAEIDTLRLSFPSRQKQLPWKLLFSTGVDGVSLDTLFKKCERKQPVVFIVLADDKTKFGAYLSEGIKKSKSFYGTGETFVFTYNPLLTVYKWTSKNNYFCAASQDDISVGNNKKGGAAIYLGESMSTGFSDPCDTFGSPKLSKEPQFKVIDVEVWSIETIV